MFVNAFVPASKQQEPRRKEKSFSSVCWNEIMTLLKFADSLLKLSSIAIMKGRLEKRFKKIKVQNSLLKMCKKNLTLWYSVIPPDQIWQWKTKDEDLNQFILLHYQSVSMYNCKVEVVQ